MAKRLVAGLFLLLMVGTIFAANSTPLMSSLPSTVCYTKELKTWLAVVIADTTGYFYKFPPNCIGAAIFHRNSGDSLIGSIPGLYKEDLTGKRTDNWTAKAFTAQATTDTCFLYGNLAGELYKITYVKGTIDTLFGWLYLLDKEGTAIWNP